MLRWLAGVLGSRSSHPGAAGSSASAGFATPSFEALYTATRIISSGTDVAVSGEQTLDVLRAAIRMDAGTMFRLDGAQRALVLVAASGVSPEHIEPLRVRPIEESALREAIRTGHSIVVPFRDAAVGGAVRAVIDEAGYRTLLALPIPADGRTWGVMSFVSREERDFDRETLQLLEVVAYQVGLAVGRATLLAEERARRAHLAALLEINTKIGALAPTEALLSSIADEAARLLGVDNAGFRLLEGDELVLAGLSGTAGETMTKPRLKVGESMSGKVVAMGRALRFDIASVADIIPEHRTAGQRLGYTKYLGVPLRVGDRTIGVLSFRASRAFTELDQEVAEAFAAQAAIALEHSRLFQEATRRGREASELAALAGSLTQSLRVDEVADRIVAAVLPLFHARSANLRVRAPDGSLLAVARGEEPSAMSPRGNVLPPGYGISGHVVATGKPFRTTDILEEPDLRLPEEGRRNVLASGDHAFMAVPLRAKGRIIGAIAISDRRGRVFTDGDVGLLQSFADQAALALENAGLYEETERRRREAEVVADVARDLSAALDLDALLQRVTLAARDLCHADLGMIALRDPLTGAMVLRQTVGARAHFVDAPIVERGKGLGGLVIEAKRPFRTEDYLADPRIGPDYAAAARAEGIVAEMVVPLLSAGEVEGLLYVDRRMPRPFSDRDESVLMQLADHAAIAVTNARLYAAASGRAARLATLNRLNRLVSSSLDTSEVLADIARAAGEFMNASMVVFWLADDTTQTLRAAATSDPEMGAYFKARTLRYGDEAAGWAARHRMPLNVPDVLAPDSPVGSRDWIAAHGIKSLLAVPLLHNDGLLAVVTLTGREPFRLGGDDRELLESFLAQAGVAIRNAGLYAETDRRRREAEVLAELGASISASLDLDTVLDRVVTGARDLCGSDVARILLREPGSDGVVARASVGHRSDGWNTLRIEPGQGVGGLVLSTGRPFRTSDDLGDPRIDQSDEALVRAEGLVASLAVPILIDGSVEGLLHVDNRSPRPFTDQDESILARLADQAAVAIRNARLYRETSAYAERLRALDEVNRLVSSSLNPDEVLRNIVAAAARFFDAPWVSMWVVDEARHRVVRSFVIGDGGRAAALPTEFAMGEGAVGWVAQQRQPIFWTGAPDPRLPAGIADRLRDFGMGFRLVYPIAIGDRVLGVLTANRATEVTMTPETEALLRSLASQAGLALDHARLFSETARRLRETQTLLAVTEALAQPASSDETMRRVARELGRATTADMVGAYFLNQKKDALVALAGYHVPPELVELFRRRSMRPATFPFVAEALASGRTAWSADALCDPRFDPAWIEGLPPHAVLFVPTLAQGQPMGGLFLTWSQPGRAFPGDEIPLVEGVARQVGLALENAELSRQTRTKLRETETLLSVSRVLASTLDLDAMLRHFMREAARTLDADTMAFWMITSDGEWLEPFAGYHVPPEHLEHFRTLRVSAVHDGFYAEAVRRRQPMFSALGQDDPRLPASVRALPHTSQLFTPIVAKDQVIGAVAAVWWHRSRELSPSELTLLEGLASQAGVAVESARLFTENRRQVRELSTLYDLSRAVTGQLERRALVEAVYTHLERVTDVRNMTMLVRDDDAGHVEVALRTRQGVRDAETAGHAGDGAPLLTHVLAEGRSLRTADYPAECERLGLRPTAYARGFRHWLGVPMKAGDHVLGGIAVRRAERAYTEADERLLTNVADLAALALRSARLYDERARAFGELSAAQDQLVRTEKLRALGEMASGVAHDFNNLLAAILGRAQLLLQRVEEPRLRGWLQVIERSALDGAQTVRRLQEFTRIRRDQQFVTVDLNQVVRDALDITQSRWREEPSSRGITIDVRTVLADIPTVAGDPVELREALTNLVLNAVDAMPNGGRLSLTTARAGGLVEVAVTDTGIGMPDAVRQRIFDPFFTTKGAQGTGLGLSITYGIVTRHRARMTVDTEPGQGTTFRIVFEPGGTPDEARPTPAATTTGTAALRCLVVDDEEMVGAVLGDILETNGHSAVVLTNPAEAIERFRREPFDLVFTDLAMPEVSGWQVARAVKAAAPEVPVFLVTGFGVELSAEERRAHGVDLILPKPLDIDSVLEAVAGVASRRDEQ